MGFFALLALAQAVLNLFRPSPALWPGLLAGALCVLTWWLVRRWLRWREGPAGAAAP
ncbi:hypothetical protein [Corynebacterium liangguodongii]|uniref:hypothetical protein n=1 Tax=Corynebacterium liangguodongii TaxID=2079535 RepID=UPI00399F489C